MPKKLFFQLDSGKRAVIFNAALADFAQHGYLNASTNRIAQTAGISKGSLFKYFGSKERLYFFILDSVTTELTENMVEREKALPTELFQRIVRYAEFELDWYIQYPEKYKLIIGAFAKNDTEIFRKVEARYGLTGKDIYYNLVRSTDLSRLKGDREKIFNILKWFLNGFTETFIGGLQTNQKLEIGDIRNEYIESLREHLAILKTGFIDEG